MLNMAGCHAGVLVCSARHDNEEIVRSSFRRVLLNDILGDSPMSPVALFQSLAFVSTPVH